jgi:tetratricopeptide (TPR) repeat protein
VVARPAEGVARMALSRDGERLATGGPDGTVRVWDVAGRAEPQTIVPFRAEVTGLAFSADGRRLAMAGYLLLRVCDVATGRFVADAPSNGARITALAWGPDGRVLAAGQGHGARLWNADALTLLREVEPVPLDITSLVFRPDGQRIAVAGVGRYAVQAEVATGRQLHSLQLAHDQRVMGGVAYSPDGRRLASGSEDGSVQTWEADTGKEDRRPVLFRGHSGPVNCLTYSPDGTRLATGGADRTARVWDVATGKELLTLRLPSPVRGVIFSPDGDALYTQDTEAVRVWETWGPQESSGPNRWLRAALAYGSAGDWDRARQRLDRAAALASDAAAVALARSWVEARSGRPDEAQAARAEAARLSQVPPLNPATGWPNRTLPAALAPEQRRVALDALRVLEDAERARPQRDAGAAADFWRACGLGRCALRDWPGAAADLTVALSRDPDDWAARQARARVRAELDQWEGAEADCTAALEARPEGWECWYLRALTRFVRLRNAEAEADLTEALARGGDGSAVRRARILLGRKLGLWDHVLADATAVLKTQLFDLSMLLARAEAYEGLGRLEEAAADWAIVAKFAPGDLSAPLGLARLRLRRQEWDQAADDFVKLAQRHPGCYLEVEASYARAGAGERATEFYARLLRLEPDDMDLRRAAALLPARFSRWEEAAAGFATLIEREPGADANVWFDHVSLRVLVGDREGYRKATTAMLKRAEEKKDLWGFLLARACTLAPLPAEDIKRAARIAEPDLAQYGNWQALVVRGALEVRAGQPGRAVPPLRQVLTEMPQWEGSVIPRMWLALALHAQGQKEEARAELAAAREVLDRWGKEMPRKAKPGTVALDDHSWLEAQILRREVEVVVGGKKAEGPN